MYEETFKNLEYQHEENSWINLAGFNVIIVNPLLYLYNLLR